MKCIKCGNENPENSAFCVSCGSQLQATNNQGVMAGQPVNNYNQGNPNNNTSNNNSKKTIIIIVAVIGGLLVLGGLIFGGIHLYTQYKLQQADKEIQDWIDDIGDLDSIEIPDDQNNKVEEYDVGDAVELLDNSKWHIVSISGDNVVLLSDTLALETSGYGKTDAPEDQTYEKSSIKEYLENTYLPNLKTNLSSKNGDTNNLRVRLLTLNEFVPLTNARWVSSTGELKLSSYSIYKSDAGDNFTWLSMTSNFWLQDYIIDDQNNGFFYGAYYVEVDIDESSEYFSTMQIETDQCGIAASNENCASFYGVRPVIETTIENIK